METGPVNIDDLGLTTEQRKAAGFVAEYTRRLVWIGFSGQRTPEGASGLIQEIYRFADELLAGCLKNGTELP